MNYPWSIKITYIVASHVGKTVAPEDGDFVIVCRYHEGRACNVYPRVPVCHSLGGLVVALPGDISLEPGLVILNGDLGHLHVTP